MTWGRGWFIYKLHFRDRKIWDTEYFISWNAERVWSWKGRSTHLGHRWTVTCCVHLHWRMCMFPNWSAALTCVWNFMPVDPCLDDTYDHICTIRIEHERAPSEDIKLLVFILHLQWTLCLIDCLKGKGKKNPWIWKEVKIPRRKLWKHQFKKKKKKCSFSKLQRLMEGSFWLDFCKESRVARIKPLNRMLWELRFAWVQNIK